MIAATEAGDAGDEGFRDLQVAGLQSQAADLEEEIADYESLRYSGTTVIEASSLAGLADALIKARVARGWTQRQFADRLGVAEQQVQRYESTVYRSASLARLCDIADALGFSPSDINAIGAAFRTPVPPELALLLQAAVPVSAKWARCPSGYSP